MTEHELQARLAELEAENTKLVMEYARCRDEKRDAQFWARDYKRRYEYVKEQLMFYNKCGLLPPSDPDFKEGLP